MSTIRVIFGDRGSGKTALNAYLALSSMKDRQRYLQSCDTIEYQNSLGYDFELPPLEHVTYCNFDFHDEFDTFRYKLNPFRMNMPNNEGIEYAKDLISKAHAKGKLVSFDINFRTDIFKNIEQAVKTYKEILELADIVKFSEDEVEIFNEDYVNSLKDKLVCISLGKDGSKYFYNNLTNKIPSIKVKPVDTTGAGDAFYAGILSQINGLTKEDWTKEKLDYAPHIFPNKKA